MRSEHWFGITEAAAVLGVKVETLRRWADEGLVAHQRTLGNQRRFQRSVLEAVLASMDRGAHTKAAG